MAQLNHRRLLASAIESWVNANDGSALHIENGQTRMMTIECTFPCDNGPTQVVRVHLDPTEFVDAQGGLATRAMD